MVIHIILVNNSYKNLYVLIVTDTVTAEAQLADSFCLSHQSTHSSFIKTSSRAYGYRLQQKSDPKIV